MGKCANRYNFIVKNWKNQLVLGNGWVLYLIKYKNIDIIWIKFMILMYFFVEKAEKEIREWISIAKPLEMRYHKISSLCSSYKTVNL